MKNPFPNAPEKQNMSIMAPPGCSINDGQQVIRSPGEYSGDPVVKEWQKAQAILLEEEEELQKKLSDLADNTGMPITQENGQRRFGPPLDEKLEPPARGSEVFVGRLPRDCYEPELVPVLESVGRIYELRMMMNFSGHNRGYCFVQYFTPAEAQRAILELNNYEIRPGYNMGVTKSVDNCRLFIGQIPTDKSAEEIKNEMDKLIDGVVKVLVKPPRDAPKEVKNRGFAFVEFVSHRAAAMARRKLIPGTLKLWGEDFAVDWADPEPECKEIIVQNLSPYTTQESLWQIFGSVSNNGVWRVWKRDTHAYISFLTSHHAIVAKDAMEQAWIDGRQVEVNFSRFSKNSYSPPSTKGNSVGMVENNNNHQRFQSPSVPLNYQKFGVHGFKTAENMNYQRNKPLHHKQRTQTKHSVPSTPWNFGVILKNGEFTRVNELCKNYGNQNQPPPYSPASLGYGYYYFDLQCTPQSPPSPILPFPSSSGVSTPGLGGENVYSPLPISPHPAARESPYSDESQSDSYGCMAMDNFYHQLAFNPVAPWTRCY